MSSSSSCFSVPGSQTTLLAPAHATSAPRVGGILPIAVLDSRESARGGENLSSPSVICRSPGCSQRCCQDCTTAESHDVEIANRTSLSNDSTQRNLGFNHVGQRIW
eukprot:1329617-Rhodomonas_salina.2